MARTLNKVMLIGRLGRDPDVRYSQTGMPIVRFSLATDERVPAGEGNWEDRTEWHRVVVFGKTAEFCANYLSKGRLVYVEGRLRTNQWEDAQGVRRYTTEIIARDVMFLDSSRDATTDVAPTPGAAAKEISPAEELPEMAGPPPDDDIPF